MMTGGLKLPKSCLGATGNSAFPLHPMVPSVRTTTPRHQAERETRGNLKARSAIATSDTGRRVYPGKNGARPVMFTGSVPIIGTTRARYCGFSEGFPRFKRAPISTRGAGVLAAVLSD